MSLPLIGTMIVAYLTAHLDEVTDLYTFVTAPPFLNLFTCLLVLVFGPGSVFRRLSDRQIPARIGLLLPLDRRRQLPVAAVRPFEFAPNSSQRNALMKSTSRRQFHQLALAALSGTMAGGILGCSREQQQKTPEKNPADSAPEPAAAAKTYDEQLLLVGDPHVCRGLNECKDQGKTKMNDSAGQARVPRRKSMAAMA